MTDNTINNDMTMGGATGALLAGRYRVVRQLGQGGMGSVWLAEDTKLDGFKVAVKMLPSVLVNNKRAYAQVKAEALVSLKLSHSNIATVRAFEEEGGSPFLVMDYIDGQTLDDYLAEKGKLTEEETVKLLKPVAVALDYAHTQGVVHRDVKPGNVMISNDGTPFVLDFGIAREIQETMTRVTGKLSSGTLLYMSPEQLNGDAPKPTQDIYSFAAMVYECLKGEPPFSRGGIEDQIKHKMPEPLGPQFANCGPGVMAGLAKSPEKRPGCCAAMLEKNGKGAARTGTGVSASKTRIAVVGALLALAAVVGVGGWFGWSVYCRAEENRLAAIKAEMKRKSDLRRLELEADRLASQVNEAQRVSVREQFAGREGLGTKVKELEDAAKSGQLALSVTNLVAATNWFHIALNCSDWLSSNAVLHAQCMRAAQVALKARKAADAADAKNLASNEYGMAFQAYESASNEMHRAAFVVARKSFEKVSEDFSNVTARALKERNRIDCENLRKNVALRMRERASESLEELKALDVEDGFAENIDMAQASYREAVVKYDRCEWNSAVEAFSNLIFVCQGLRKLDKQRRMALEAKSAAHAEFCFIKKQLLGIETNFIVKAMMMMEVGAKEESEGVLNFNAMRFCEATSNFQKAKELFASARSIISDEKDVSEKLFRRGFGCYMGGKPEEAVKWLRQAAERGHAEAQGRLASLFETGYGVGGSFEQAYNWHLKAASQGLRTSQRWMGGVYAYGKNRLPISGVEALRWIGPLANEGDACGQRLMGYLYEKGIGVPQSNVEAFQFYLKAANQDDCWAQTEVGRCYEGGLGVEQSYSLAMEWYRKGARYASAQYDLGRRYEYGLCGVAVDLNEARRWYGKAADVNFEQAKIALRRLSNQ